MTGGSTSRGFLHPWGFYIHGGVHLVGSASRRVCIGMGGGRGWADPPNAWDRTSMGYSQQAGSMHPTGMLSCFSI